MTDHHEPATAVAVPSPSSAVVPEHHSEIKSAATGQEDLKNDLTPNTSDRVKITAPSPLHVEIHPEKKEHSAGVIVSTEVNIE